MQTDVTRIWNDILSFNRLEFEKDREKVKLINNTTNYLVAEGDSPGEVLNKYFAIQVSNIDWSSLTAI